MWRLYLLLVFFTSVVLVIQGSVGPPILYTSSQPGPALFLWSISDVDTSVVVVVTSPREEGVFFFFFNGNGTSRYDISSHYKDRIINFSFTKDSIQFSLSDVTRNDAGNYTCREGDEKGPYIPNCGEILYYIDENSMVMMPHASISKQLREGHTLTLTCVTEVTSLPLSPLSWTFQQSASTPPPPPPPPPQQLQETGVTLTLGPLTREDSGQYTCQINSVAGQSNLNLTVIGTYKMIPRPSLGSWTIPVLHQPFELNCIVFGLPQNHDINLTYTWFKDSIEISGQTSQSLLFPRLTKKDGGMYKCIARSGHVLTTSPESNKKDVFILLPPSVHIEPATPDNVIRRAAGEELTLTCEVTEAFPWVPADGYSWSYLPSHNGPRRPLVGRGKTLRLDPLTREDSGQYFCQARNDLEVFQGLIPPGNASVTVDVAYMEQITLTADFEVKEGHRLTLTCSVDSNPTARLSWIVDGQEVRHVTYNVDHYLLERAACSDSKTYTCRASNADLPGLERHASTNVEVVCNGNEPLTVNIEPATPHTVYKPAAGEELSLHCKVTETIPFVPHGGHSWSYLPSNQGPRRPLVERESTLRLGPLTREDSGQYSCQASSELEIIPGRVLSGNASFFVDVVYMEEITLTSDLEVKEGHRLNLTCSVDCNPTARLTWIVDGREVRHMTANTDHYVLERAACSDNKTYTCRASNSDLPGLERHASANVRVLCKQEDSVTGSAPPSLLTSSPLSWLLAVLLLPLTLPRL